MFYITNLELTNYIQFSKRGEKFVSIEFEKGINLFTAPNGFGKSTIMKELNPFNRNGNDPITIDGDGRKKIVYGKIGDDRYRLEILHTFTKTKTGHTIKTSVLETIDGDIKELNPSNNNKSGEEIISSVLGINKSSLKATGIGIKYGRSIFNFFEADDRSKYNFVKDILNLDVYNKYEKIVGEKLRDTKRDVDSLRKSLKPLTEDYDTVIENIDSRISVLKEHKNEEDNLIKKLSEELNECYSSIRNLPNENDLVGYSKLLELLKEHKLDFDYRKLNDKLEKDKQELIFIDEGLNEMRMRCTSLSMDIVKLESKIDDDNSKDKLNERLAEIDKLQLDKTDEEIEEGLLKAEELSAKSSRLSLTLSLSDVLTFDDIRNKSIEDLELRIKELRDIVTNIDKDIQIFHDRNFNIRVIDLFKDINERSEPYDKILNQLDKDVIKANGINLDELNGTKNEITGSIIPDLNSFIATIERCGVFKHNSDELHSQYINMKNEYYNYQIISDKIKSREGIIEELKVLSNLEEEIQRLKNLHKDKLNEIDDLEKSKHNYIYIRSVEPHMGRLEELNELGINNTNELSLYIINVRKEVTSIDNQIQEINSSIAKSKDSSVDKELEELWEVRNDRVAKKNYRNDLNNNLMGKIDIQKELDSVFKVVRDEIPMIVMRDFLTDIRLSTNMYIGDNHSFKVHDIRVDSGTYYEFKCTIINDAVLMEAVSLSSGEQAILLLAMLTAFMNHLSKDYMILRLDEADATLDSNYRYRYIDILLSKAVSEIGQIFIITHNDQYKERKDEINIIEL